jgi:predicted nuclease with TOPRIM domain
MRKDIDEIQGKLQAAQDGLKILEVPPACNKLNELTHKELDLLSQLREKSLALGDKVSTLKGVSSFSDLKELQPQIEDWKQLLARQTEMRSSFEAAVSDLRRQEKL